MAYSDEERALIAAAVARRAVRGGGFALATLAVRQLRTTPVVTTFPGWERQLDEILGWAMTSIAAAAVRVRDGVRDAKAGKCLMGALAWAAGNGMPARDIWPTVASALAGQPDVYGPDDVRWALVQFSDFIVESSEEDQAVFRLSHPLFAQELRQSFSEDEDADVRIGMALHGLYVDESSSVRRAREVNPYLRRYLSRHLVEAGSAGTTLLEELARGEPSLYGHAAISALREEAMRRRAAGRAEVALMRSAVSLVEDLWVGGSIDLKLRDAGSIMLDYALIAHDAELDPEAVEATAEAYRIFQSLGAEDPTYIDNLVHVCVLRGVALQSVGEDAAAVEVAREGIRWAEQSTSGERESLLFQAFTALGNRLAGAGDVDGALNASYRAYKTLMQSPDAGDVTKHSAALWNLVARTSAVEDYDQAVRIIEGALEWFESLPPEVKPQGLTLRCLRQRVALANVRGEDPVPFVLRFVRAWVESWLGAPTVAARLRLLEGEPAPTLEAVATVALPRVRKDLPEGSLPAGELDALEGVLELWQANQTLARRCFGEPFFLDDQIHAARVVGDYQSLRLLSCLQLALRRREAEAWHDIAVLLEAEGEVRRAEVARKHWRRIAHESSSTPEPAVIPDPADTSGQQTDDTGYTDRE